MLFDVEGGFMSVSYCKIDEGVREVYYYVFLKL
jgi:hypothetical protein